MIRRKPLRRAPWPRRQPDQPRARGRATASAEQWQAIRDVVLARAGWRCQACGRGGRLDVHHVVKRSQGGSDFDLDQLVALCRWCHDQTDAPYERGRLVVTAVGAGQFTFEVVQRAWRGPVKPGPTSARVGKIRPFDDDRDSSVLG
jgi:5-methylcytosine-specific restriction endonuclease McrA